MDTQREITELKNRVARLEYQLRRVMNKVDLEDEDAGPVTTGGSVGVDV